MIALLLLLMLLLGVSLGLLGGGGAVIALPALVYLAGVEAHEAVPMSLAIVGASAVAAALQHWRMGNVQVRGAAWFGLAGIAGAWIGARFTHLVSRENLLLLFSVLLLAVGMRMLARSRQAAVAPDRAPQRHSLLLLAAGAVVGGLSGFLGVGGGFLIVPALLFFAGFEMKQAVGTSLAVIALISASGLASHLLHIMVDGWATLLYSLAALLGTVAGVRLAGRLPASTLQRAFGGLILIVGVVMAYLSFPAVLR